MKRFTILGVFLIGGLLAHPVLAAELSATFSVKQSQALGLSEGQQVTVRLSFNPDVPGVKERGMAGSPQVRFKGAISEISIDTKSQVLTFPGAFDIVVMSMRKQWVAGASKWMTDPKSTKPQIEAFTLSLEYPEGVLKEDSPVPPEGGMPAKKARAFTIGVDLLAMRRLEDPTKGWSVAAELVSYKVQK